MCLLLALTKHHIQQNSKLRLYLLSMFCPAHFSSDETLKNSILPETGLRHVTAVTSFPLFSGLHPSRLFPSLFSFTSPCSCPTWHAALLVAFSLLFLSLPLTFPPHHWPLLLYLPFITSALLLFSHSVCQSSSFLSCRFFSCTAVFVSFLSSCPALFPPLPLNQFIIYRLSRPLSLDSPFLFVPFLSSSRPF